MILVHGGEECLLCRVEGVPANWKPTEAVWVNFTEIVV